MPAITQQVLEERHNYNEAEVRRFIIDPTLEKLGYPGGDGVFLKLEEKLEYPYHFIGHKSKKRDQPLGFPDYRAGLKGGRGSFITEAKSINAKISKKDIEQAHSYAAHAQVGANYFLLCDGEQFLVYETLSGPECKPILEICVQELDARFHELENILSPPALAKNCRVIYDSGLKICEGLGSSAKIHSGVYLMDDWAYRVFVNGADCTEMLKNSVPQFDEVDDQFDMLSREFDLRVGSGFAKRNADGQICAKLSFPGVTKNNLKSMQLLGVDNMEFATKEKFLSVDPSNPTAFESSVEYSIDKGTLVPPLFGEAIPADTDMNGDLFISARMYKKGEQIRGEYSAFADYWFDLSGLGTMKVEADFIGNFTLNLIS